ncbi:MAG: hypothetical protein WA705_10320 [Candidatus Ozemobacteraceae bacterium]
MQRMMNLLSRIIFPVFIFLLVSFPVCGKTGLVFVEPFPGPEITVPTSLKEVRAINVRGGKALYFKIVDLNKTPELQNIARSLESSRAVQKSLELLEQARKLGPAPCQEWLTCETSLPVWVKSSGGKGAGICVPIPVRIQDGNEGWDAAAVLMVEPLDFPGKSGGGVSPLTGGIPMENPDGVGKCLEGTRFSGVNELAAAGILVPMVCHEIFHMIQAELYRERYLLLDILSQMPGIPHDSPVETDPQIAFKEGFAEFGELWLAGLYPSEFNYSSSNAGIRPQMVELGRQLQKHRIALSERNRYIFQSNGQIKDGKLKQGNTDLSTEGVISSLLYTLSGHSGLEDPLTPIFRAMSHTAPASFFEFVSTLITENKDQSETIRRILLEYTCYTIQSREALAYYEKYYLTKKAFLLGQTKREGFEKARLAWEDWKEAQRQRIASGTPLCIAVPHPLMVTTRQGYSLDLNDEMEDRLTWHLEAFFPPSSSKDAPRLAQLYSRRILEKRKELGAFESVDQLVGILPQELLGKFKAGFRRFLQLAEKRLDSEVTRRRTLNGF